MKKKTKYLQLRLKPEEVAILKEKAAAYDSVSQYTLCAIKAFSNFNAKQRFDLINMLGKHYTKAWNKLSWAGGNINQTVKRTKELVDAGIITPYFLENVVMPETNKTMAMINEIKKKIDSTTDKAIKLGLIR